MQKERTEVRRKTNHSSKQIQRNMTGKGKTMKKENNR